MCGFVIANAMYATYNLTKYYNWNIDAGLLAFWFFAATVAALYSTCKIFQSKK